MKASEYLKRPYTRTVIPEADGTFRGGILEFPGCIAAGDTAAAALARLEDVAASWLASMFARKQPIPEPLEASDYSGKLVLRLPKSVHQKAAMTARRDGVSLNTFIATCVAEHVGLRARPLLVTATQVHANFSLHIDGSFMPATRGGWPVSREQIATSSENKFLGIPIGKLKEEDVYAGT